MALSLRDVAEDAYAFLEHPGVEFERTPQLVLRNFDNPHPFYGLALRPRLVDAEASIAHARAWFAARGRASFIWFVSDASQPADFCERLLAAGAVPHPEEPLQAGMVLTEPPEMVEGIEVRRVSSFEDYAAAAEIGWQAFNFSEQTRSEARSKLRENYRVFCDDPTGDDFVAWIDGEIVGSGGVDYLPCCGYLLGGNVAEHARGRGVYRALVHARWRAASERGTTALVVQAGQMSRPILERLGFKTLCTVRAFLDSAAT